MRIFQACGLADRVAPFTTPHRGTHFLGVDGRVIKKFEPMAPPYPLGWPPTSTFVQPELERVLREGVTGQSVELFLGHRALDFSQDEHCVDLSVRELEGKDRVLRARTLLGCDGANSFVRKRLGIGIEDLGFDEWWMVVDVRITQSVELPPRSIQYC
jgi:3-(3-hydroxy-phenyl)propionate hydroxylase